MEKIFGLKDAGLAWFGKIKEGLKSRGFVESQVDTYAWYIEDITVLFNVDDAIIIIPFKDKNSDVYVYWKKYFKTEDPR